MKEYDIQPEQKFNMSLATLERIHNIILQVQSYRLMGDAPILLRCLGLLLKEIYPFLKDSEKVKARKEYANLNQLINTGKLQGSNGYLFNELDDFEFWLRDQLHIKGLLMAKGQDSRWAAANG